jgi:hypothetical protein
MFLIIEPKTDADIKLRERYLTNFYMETFEPGGTAMDLAKRPKDVTRSEIRDYLASGFPTPDPRSSKVSKVLYQTYSGYVHSNSPHLMEMWDFKTKQFEISGSQDVGQQQSHIDDAINHFARGFFSVAGLATMLGDRDLSQVMLKIADQLSGIS